LFEGENINLRVADKSDVPLVNEWWSNKLYMGEHQDIMTVSEAGLEEVMLQGTVFFIIEKKDGTRIGHINSWTREKTREIGYALVPSERGKGYGTEAIKMMLDYLFLNTDVEKIQAPTEQDNLPSQKVLIKAGFTKDRRIMKVSYIKGEYRDVYLYSILREEWNSRRVSKRNWSQNDLY